jgi:PAS domain S-box-containing protein
MKTAYSTYELEERERLFRTVFEDAPDAIFIEDLEGNVLDVNPAACRLHRLTRDQLLGKNVSELVPADHRPDVVGQAQLIEREVEGYSLTADGKQIPVSIRSSVISYMGRVAILLHVRDITERRRAEAAIRESEERYRLLFDCNPQPMWVHDLETRRFLAVNEAAQRLYRYSRDEFLLMKSIDQISGQGGSESDLPSLPNLVQVSGAKHCRKDGTCVSVELTQHTITMDGRFVAFVMISKVGSASRLKKE